MRAIPFGATALLFVLPLAARAQMQPIPVPTPAPTTMPSSSPLPYPAYGPPAPDVQLLVPHPGVPQHVSLAQAIDIAIAVSPNFIGQRAVYSELRARYAAEEQALFPAVSANGLWEKSFSVTNNRGCNTLFPATCTTGTQITTQESAGYTVSQLIFDGGRVIAAIKAAKESELAGRGTLLRELDTLAYDVAQNYYAVLQDEALVTADEQLVREFETEENAVRAQIRNGVSALSALAQAEFQAAQARGSLVQAQGAAITAQAQFATLLGLDADTQIVPEPLGPDTYSATPTYAKSLAQALLLRPDYQSSQYTVTSDQSNLRYAELARFPTVTGQFNDSTARQFPALPEPYGNDGHWIPSRSLSASISIPIYDQGQTWYNIEVAKYTLQEANASLAETRLTVESDVRSSLAQLFSARANFTQAQAALSAAEVSMQAARASYKVGVDTILDLVTAEANLATAQSNDIAALYGVRNAEQNYLYATGLSDLRL
ncbi:MAG: TolC family protein [Candidatus Tyrphobacter sp.]